MLHSLQILPLAEHSVIGFHLLHGFGPFESVALEPGDEVVEDEGIGPLGPIVGQNADEQQVYDVGLVPLDDTQQVPPATRKQLSTTAAEGMGERGEGDAEADEAVIGCIPVFNHGDEIEIRHLYITVHELVYLPFGQLGVAIKVAISDVHHLEHASPASLTKQFVAGELAHMQVVAALDEGRSLCKLLGNHLGHLHLIFQIVVVFLETAHALNVPGIVGMVVVGIHRGQLVKAFNEQSLAIHVGETQRAHHFGHALSAAPLFHSGHQRL